MTSTGYQERKGNADFQMKVIGVLVTISLAILSWSFAQWSKTVADGFSQVMVKLEKIESRGEQRDSRLNELSGNVLVLGERQKILRERLDKHEGSH